VALVVALLVCSASFAGCTGDARERPVDRSPSPVALSVRTVHADDLPAGTRSRLEGEVGDLLSAYVVRAFLGRYPREDFVPAFSSFTPGAARSAARDIDVLTGAPWSAASSVRATRLDARLSFLLDDGRAVGATAGVRLAFAADVDGRRRAADLRGRLLLVRQGGTWSVFGYDVARDDGASVVTGSSP
jgi:hypothetical protein